jgi:acyl-CoA synthetase (AMP-forming)/AMP-acid ligase II/esterase/lipase/1-acyl-sn-glycerol-3-phosphate acyltransferase
MGGAGRWVFPVMSANPELRINESLYQWCVRAFSLLRRRLGINIKVHNADHHIQDGQIFLFNHFARFETIIPQYFIYQATGAYCRCVAAHKLFLGNETFAGFLRSCGAVPNNLPGLLPFLAAEILRGRKVIFFPEGSMIKDRKVVAPGQTSWFFRPPPFRHRQGAAALALMLEIFKKRILTVDAAGDTERLERWVRALGLADIGALVAAARQPTLVVPANITFYPIHTSDNFLRRAAELFGRDLSEESKEELLIEGNLVLRRTDMDIRFGDPVHPRIRWSFFDRFVLDQVFEHIDSLDDLFAFNRKASRWLDRMIAVTMRRRTQRLRDLCMVHMYDRLTVNLSHLASRLMLALFDQGTTEIGHERCHELLYRVLKKIQSDPSIHLHRSLADPEEYREVVTGRSRLWRQFLDAAVASNLIAVTATTYRLLPSLRNNNGRRDPRLENVIQVYANELAPLLPACRTIEELARLDDELPPARRARLLFDDEKRAYSMAKESFSKARHLAINSLETASESGEPYLLARDDSQKLGVVLVHGFLASPAELRSFGERLAAMGYPVLGVRLAGHGTSPWDLRERSWQDWLASVRRGYEIMLGLADRVCLIGFATGGSLALRLAADRPDRLAGVVAVSPHLRFNNRNLVSVPVLHGINRLAEWVSAEEGVMPFRINPSEHPHINYRHVPIRGLFELRRVTEDLYRRLPEVLCPALILQATEDPIVEADSANRIHDRLGSTDKTLEFIAAARHGILNEDIGDIQMRIQATIQSWSRRQESIMVPEKKRPDQPREHANATAGDQGAAERIAETMIGEGLGGSLRAMLAQLRRIRPQRKVRLERPYPWEQSYPPGLRWDAALEARSLPDLLARAVEEFADKPCLRFRGKHYTYREVGRLVDRAARGFQLLGVRRGIKVGVMLPNCPYAVICFYAILKAGGTVVNINPLYSRLEIERQVADSDCRMLVSLDVKGLYEKVAGLAVSGTHIEKLIVCRTKGMLRFHEKVVFGLFKGREVATVVEDRQHVTFERLTDNDGAPDAVALDPHRDIAVLQYTGGTTGFAKGAELSHANLYINTAQLALWAGEARRGMEKTLAVLPLFHSFGMTAVMNLSLWIGAEIVLLAKFQTAEVLDTISTEKPTIFIGVPTMFSALIAARNIADHDLSSLRFCISGGAALPLEVQRKFETLSGCPVVEGYGLSEASPVCSVNPLAGGKPGSVGLPLPQTMVEIVSLENRDRLLAANEHGEICITGPQVMVGYANRAQENIDVFQGRRMHTGDVGYLDAEGYLFIVDRIKDLILSGGFNVYPRQVEEVLYQHPAIEEAAVVGVPDKHRGEIIKAYVKLKEGASLTLAQLREFCTDKLAPFQMPRELEVRVTLPKTLIGKISKRDLLTGTMAPDSEPAAGVRAEARA